MPISSEEARLANWQRLRNDIAMQEDIAARLRDGRMRTFTRHLGEPEKDTTEADAAHCDHIVASLREVIEMFYSDLDVEQSE